MRVAICQSHILFEEKQSNIENAVNAIHRASEQNTDLILFPEMSFTGFSMNAKKIGESDFYTMNVMKKESQNHKIAIGFGWVKKINNSQDTIEYENHYTIISSQGQVVLDYAKIHPFSYAGEHLVYRKGENLSFGKMNEFCISTAICYDLRFPEIFQAQSKCADIIFVPANWPESRRNHWLTLLQARAIENQSYIIGINCTGEMNHLRYSGDSLVVHPNGTILHQLQEKEELFIFDLDNEVAKTREKFQVKQDRREELYSLFYRKC